MFLVDPKKFEEDILKETGLNLNQIEEKLSTYDVLLPEDKIKEYLIERRKKVDKKIAEDPNEQFINKVILDMKYNYEPYTYYYYKKKINILKNKCYKFIDIIKNLMNNTLDDKITEELDINKNEWGYMSNVDYERILKPFIFNFKVLVQLMLEANELSTYENRKVSLDHLYRNGLSEQDLYPSEELQVRHNEFNIGGYIPLTEKQEAKFLEEDLKTTEKLFKLIDDNSFKL